MGLGGKRFGRHWASRATRCRPSTTAPARRAGGANGRRARASARGLLTTATGLLFTGDGSGNFVALDAKNGDLLWHTRIGNITNAPQTFDIDGKQYVLVGVGDTLYSFVLY